MLEAAELVVSGDQCNGMRKMSCVNFVAKVHGISQQVFTNIEANFM